MYASDHKSRFCPILSLAYVIDDQINMDDYIDEIDRINVVERLIRREQVIRDRQNPFLNYSEDEFIDRYRLKNKECV
jgi:hypothetical protein